MNSNDSKPVDRAQPIQPPIYADAQHSLREPSPSASLDRDNKYHVKEKALDIFVRRKAKGEPSTIETDNTKSARLPICEKLQLSARRKAHYLSCDYPMRLEVGYVWAVESAYNEDISKVNSAARTIGKLYFIEKGTHLLFSMNMEVLRVAMTGNLPLEISNGQINSIKQLYRKDSEWKIRETQQYAPAVYIRYLVNRKDQQSATPAQYLKVAQRLKDYVSGNVDTFQQAVDLENVGSDRNSSLQSIREGQHWYLQGSISRVQSILTFCEGLRRRFLELKQEEINLPLQRPLGYLECVVDPDNRLEERGRKDTSWLHHLVLNAFRLEYEDITFGYTSIVLCYLADPVEALIAEPLFSLLADTNIDTGGGFNFRNGIHMTTPGLLGLDKERKNEVLTESKAWREAHTDYNVNYAEELRRLGSGMRSFVKKREADQKESCMNREREERKRKGQDS